MDDGEYLIPDVVENVGSESDSAAKMWKFRERCAAIGEAPSHCDADVHGSDKSVTLDIEKDIDTEKEMERDGEQETEREGEAAHGIVEGCRFCWFANKSLK